MISSIIIVLLLLSVRVTLFFLYRPVLHDGQSISFTTTLLGEPLLSGNRNTVTVSYGNMFGSLALKIYYDPSQELHYGQTVKISGNIRKRLIKNFSLYSISNPKIEANSVKNNMFLAMASIIRQQTQKAYESVLSKTQASLLLGVVLGVKGNFPTDYLRELQAVGVVHVIAASGMNVSMVGSFLIGLLGKFLSRKIALVISICGICFYMLLAGFQPSIVRAGIMISIMFLSQLFGRQNIPFYSLCITIACMLLFTPSLLFDIGFQLSVASTLGILFIKPLMRAGSFFDDIATTTSAQLATLPILLANFGQYGITSIIANALVLWTVPPLMILGAAGACSSFIPYVANVFIYISQPLLWFFEQVIQFFAKMHLFIGFSEIPFSMLVGYYLILSSCIWFLWKKNTATQLRKETIPITK